MGRLVGLEAFSRAQVGDLRSHLDNKTAESKSLDASQNYRMNSGRNFMR